MGLFDWLDGIGAEEEKAKDNADYAGIKSTTAAGSNFYNTQANSAAATALQQQAQKAAAQKAQANWDAANASAAQLGGIANQATQMGLHGGAQGQAAIDAAQAAVANSGGGLGGLKNVGQAGASNAAGAAKIAQGESSNFLNQASAENNAISSAKLQQLVVNAALNHANRIDAIKANNVALGVGNLQNQTATQLGNAAMSANNQANAIQIQQQNAQNANANLWATALLSGASKGAGEVQSLLAAPTADGTSATSAYSNSLGTPQLATDPSLGLTATPDYSTAALTDPTADGLTATNSTGLTGVPSQLTLDQSLFSTPSSIFGVY